MGYLEEYDELKKTIKYHMGRYYDEDSPEISDREYDELMMRLKKIEKEHPELVNEDSPTRIIGGSTKREAGVNVEHDVPMLSIQDVFTKEEVAEWISEVKSLHPDALFDVEQKIDGLSMSIRYENGRVIMAETRGDGLIGEDVTKNALVIDDVVRELAVPQDYLEVRGEVYMTHESFERTNAEQELYGRKIFANPRNCAAGTLRQLDSTVVRQRGLSMFIFNVQKGSDEYMTSHAEALEKLSKVQGMKTVPSRICRDVAEVMEEIDRIGSLRGQLPYDIDGAVVKVDNVAYRDDFPAGSKYSAGHIAYKYPPEEKESVIRSIELSVGMTGRINPTAVFDPIRLCGTAVSRATLHNQDFIDELGIGIGQTVIVYKSGEIIPKIKGVNKDKAPKDGKVFRIPDTCPVCGHPVRREKDSADLKCVNPECSAKLMKRIVNFVSRDAMDIKGLGTESIKSLLEEGYIHDISDIYTLKDKREELIEKGIVGKEKNTAKLLEAIEASKQNPPERLLTGLAIENVGRTSAKTIMRHFGSIDLLMAAGLEELTNVRDVGEVTAASIHEFFANGDIKKLMERLKDYGLNMTSQDGGQGDDILAGRTYVITGDLVRFAKREDLVLLIEKHGGKASGSVSKKTYALINNDASSNSGKNKKAKELGIPVITEEEFLEELGDIP
ncbi:MAG: NAD-dependent DNA ligase LigA [Lachnospiraceae bacterium]|nr:NAD-dependent DNA ligase LigA [Lachnospiraceae bacterium]